MSSVTQRIKEIKQPRGGYLKPSSFDVEVLSDDFILNEENISANLIGLVVDYLSRFMIGQSPKSAFNVSLCGAEIAEKLGVKKAKKIAENLVNEIKGFDNQSIINACKLASFDVWLRNSKDAIFYAKSVDEINPDQSTIENIKIMLKNTNNFFEKYGPIIIDDFTFEKDGYTTTVDSGDGDFLTNDTLWDFKVSKNKPTKDHTLQILMYWIMGKHSKKPEFRQITKIGIFNPRLNIVYIKEISDIDNEIIKIIENEVIGY